MLKNGLTSTPTTRNQQNNSQTINPTNQQQQANIQHLKNKQNEYTIDVYYQNVQGLGTKSVAFYLSTLSCDHDIIALTETWFRDSHRTSEYFNSTYMVHRCDRNANNSSLSKGGGVVIASKLSLHCERLLQNEYLNLEFVCVKYQLEYQLVIIYCLYIPPNSALEIYRSHLDAIKSISQELNAKVIILGDFNLPEIKWILSEANDQYVPVNIRSEEAVHTCDSLARYGFSQMNNIPNKGRSHSI